MAQLESICNHNPETTVLAHMNEKAMFGVGMGQKVPDIFAAWLCSDCHDALDGRIKTNMTYLERFAEIMEAVLRTQNILFNEDKIGII
jgi:hypothetical protein